MAALFADRPPRPLQHRLVLVAQHAIWTTYDLLSHVEGPSWRFAQRIRQAKRKLAISMIVVPLIFQLTFLFWRKPQNHRALASRDSGRSGRSRSATVRGIGTAQVGLVRATFRPQIHRYAITR